MKNASGLCRYPGMHKKEVRAINKMMNRAAHSALRDVNLVLFVIDAQKWTQMTI